MSDFSIYITHVCFTFYVPPGILWLVEQGLTSHSTQWVISETRVANRVTISAKLALGLFFTVMQKIRLAVDCYTEVSLGIQCSWLPGEGLVAPWGPGPRLRKTGLMCNVTSIEKWTKLHGCNTK